MSFKIHNSKNQNGLFTNSFIEDGHILFPINGNIVMWEAMKDLPIIKSANLLQILPSEYLDISGTKEIFINHSCNPNTGIKTLGRKIVLVAIRQIKPEEEITFDYSSTCTESKEEWKMICNCKSWNCRKLISGFHYLNDEQKKFLIYKGVVPQYVIDYVGIQ